MRCEETIVTLEEMNADGYNYAAMVREEEKGMMKSESANVA